MENMLCNGILIDNLTGLESRLIIQMGFDRPIRLYNVHVHYPNLNIKLQGKIRYFLFAKYIVNLHIKCDD